MRPILGGTRPDIVIPSMTQYDDLTYPEERIFIVGLKRTCKDRWRQVTQEARRVNKKHILTLQKGMSVNQINEMQRLNVSLIVPEEYHSEYPPETRDYLISFNSFVDRVKAVYPT
jgi:hypothetical protein